MIIKYHFHVFKLKLLIWITFQLRKIYISYKYRLIDFKSVTLARQKIRGACFSGKRALANPARYKRLMRLPGNFLSCQTNGLKFYQPLRLNKPQISYLRTYLHYFRQQKNLLKNCRKISISKHRNIFVLFWCVIKIAR